MAHQSIEPEDDDRYYAGDSINIPIHFFDKNGDQPEDIPEGGRVEFRVKYDLTDDDEEAITTKDSTEPGDIWTDQITIDGEFDGDQLDDHECVVHIETGDTDAAIENNSIRVESEVVRWHARLFDEDGNRVTTTTGDWEMWAS